MTARAIALPGSAPVSGEAILKGLKDAIKGLLIPGAILALTAFTNAGTAIITNRVTQAGTAPKYIGWGTGGATAAAITQTALTTDTTFTTTQANGSGGGANTRTTGTESRTTTTNANDTYTVAGTMTSTSTQTISESGLFDQAATGGNMLIRADFTGIGVNNNDSIAFTYNLKFVSNAA